MKFGNFESLRKKKEISFVHKQGKIKQSEAFFIKYVKSERNKVAFLIRKKIGIAVVRNKIKRRVRSILSTLELEQEMNVLFFAKKEILNYDFPTLKKGIEKTLLSCYKKK